MLKISKVVSKAEAMFNAFNEHFYNGDLMIPAITVTPDGGRGAYGWMSTAKVWREGESQYHELNVCAEYLDRPLAEIACTILHEMAHLYNIQHEIEDVSNNGYYHNKRFKATAEEHGLIINQDKKYGWTITRLNAEAEEWLASTFGEQGLDVSRAAQAIVGKAGSKTSINRSRKYVCPCCGASVRATKEVNIMCVDCDEAMTLAV